MCAFLRTVIPKCVCSRCVYIYSVNVCDADLIPLLLNLFLSLPLRAVSRINTHKWSKTIHHKKTGGLVKDNFCMLLCPRYPHILHFAPVNAHRDGVTGRKLAPHMYVYVCAFILHAWRKTWRRSRNSLTSNSRSTTSCTVWHKTLACRGEKRSERE